MDPNEKILAKLQEIQLVSKKESLSELEYRELASAVGVTEQEWRRLGQAYENYLVRGQGFLEHRNPDDAISELIKARIIRPNSTEALTLLAEAYQIRWQRSKSKEDRLYAERYARKCLEFNPNDQTALRLISLMRNSEPKRLSNLEPPSPTENPRNNRSSVMILVAAMMIALGVGLILFIGLATVNNSPAPEMPAPEIGQIPESPKIAASGSSLSVDFTAPKDLPNLQFDLVSSSLHTFDQSATPSYSCKIKGYLSAPDKEFKEIKLSAEFLDGMGRVIRIEDLKISNRENSHGGDLIPLSILLYEKTKAPNIQSARISITEVEAFDAPKSYAEAPITAFDWKTTQPPGVNFEIRERSSDFSTNTVLGNKTYHRTAFEVKNIGDRSVSLLKMGIAWYDAKGNLLHESFNFVVGPNSPLLRSGQTVVKGQTFDLKGVKDKSKVDHYKLSILQLKF